MRARKEEGDKERKEEVKGWEGERPITLSIPSFITIKYHRNTPYNLIKVRFVAI